MDKQMAEALLRQQDDRAISRGLALIESNRVIIPKGYKGREEALTMKDLLEDYEASPLQRAHLACLIENTRKYFFEELSENTRLLNIGDFEKYAFQLVRAVFPNLIAHQIVSVQPMMGPTSLVFYQQFLYAKTKGTAVAGTDMLENPNATFSGEDIDAETVGTGNGSTAEYTGTLAYTPVRPGTLTVTDGTQVMTDNGQGVMIGDVTGTNTINYVTGAYDITFLVNVASGAVITAAYSFNMEANDTLPELDMNLVSAPVQARPKKLRVKWSLEATHDFKSLHGLEAEVELVGGAANELKFEIDREIVTDVKKSASATASPAVWGSSTPTGISYTEHKLSIIDTLVRMSNAIYKKTQRAQGTWIVAGLEICNVLETLPGFKGDGVMTGRGVYRLGTLNNRWTIYKDSYLADLEMVMGYKGESMWETGYIWAPYIPMYTTPTVMLDDFQGRRGIASRFGKKPVNSRFFCNGKIDTTLSGPQTLVF